MPKEDDKINNFSTRNNSLISQWNSRNNKQGDGDNEFNNKKKEQEAQYEKRSSFQEDWRSARNEIRKNKSKLKKRGLVASEKEVLNSAIKLASFRLYKLAWLNLIDSFGLTFFYLILHFVAKYVAHSNSFCHFVSLIELDSKVTKDIATGKDRADIGSMVLFGALCAVLFVVFLIIFMLLFIVIKVMTKSWLELAWDFMTGGFEKLFQ